MSKLVVLVTLLAALAAPALATAQASAATPATATAPQAVVTLDDAVKSALEHQPQLRQAQANAAAGSARVDQARGGLLPQLDLSAGYQRTGPQSALRSSSGTVRSANTWSAQVSVDQVLFDATTWFAWRSAGESAQSLRSTADTARLDVVSGVQAAYFTARAQRDLARVARETVQNDQAHLRQVQAFVDVGTQPAIALAQTRADLASAQLALIQADNAYANARAQLAQAMGLEAWSDFEVGDDTLPPVPGEDDALDALLGEALAARPELASLQAAERANQASRSGARAGYLPTVSARGTYGESGDSPSNTQGEWTAGVNLTWNLFNGGTTTARVREAEANLDALRAQDVGLRTSIRVALEQAVLGVRAARSSVQAATEAEANARERLRLAEGRFRAGAGSIIELGDAQVAVNTAAAQRVRTEYDLASARAALLRALGRT